jgi:signal peptidase I
MTALEKESILESTLFWIGCGLGAYGVFLREIFKRNEWVQKRIVPVLLHLLFMAGVGSLVGFVFSASTDLHGPSPRWPIAGAIIGFLWGAAQLLWSKSEPGGSTDLLAGDLEWVETSFSAILLASVIMYAVLQAFKIPSGSMEDTLLIGDHLFVNKFIYGIRVPFTEKRVFKIRDVKRGEVVVFEAPMEAILSPDERERGVKKDFIKRAVALAGDTVEIKNKQLYVNGQAQHDPHPVYKDRFTYPAAQLNLPAADYQKLWQSGRFAELRREQIGDNFGPIKVPEGCYFVMGDNRDGSFDSRFWGPMPNRLLKGKAWIVYWPLSRIKIIR